MQNQNQAMVVPAFSLSDLEAEAGEVQGQSGLLSKLQDIQSYTEGRKGKKGETKKAL